MHRLFPLLLLVFIAAPLHAGVLKIGTLHIEDAVPLFLAEREGFFRGNYSADFFSVFKKSS